MGVLVVFTFFTGGTFCFVLKVVDGLRISVIRATISLIPSLLANSGETDAASNCNSVVSIPIFFFSSSVNLSTYLTLFLAATLAIVF